MAELDPFFDLPYLNAPGFGDADADPAVDPVPVASQVPSAAEPTIPMPGADPVPVQQAPVLPAIMMPAGPPAGPRRRAGAAIVLAGVGLGTGALVGGAWGAGSGLVFAGATMNAYRARMLFGTGSEADRSEAVKSTIMAVLGLGVASYLGYKAHESRRTRRGDDDDDD